MYFSYHVYNDGSFFPASINSNYDKIGRGKGEGFNLNVPWNVYDKKENQMGDDEYVFIFDNILFPIFQTYCPDFVIISAGYDSAIYDPLGEIYHKNF